MQQLNWWDANVQCFDGVGMPCEITDLPMKARKQIAAAIIKGHTCGSFDEFIDENKLAKLNPDFVIELLDVCKLHKDEVARREVVSAAGE